MGNEFSKKLMLGSLSEEIADHLSPMAKPRPLGLSAAAVKWAFAKCEPQRPVTDELFDRLYDPEIRAISAVHWTPAAVAVGMARLLAPDRSSIVLDIGSGVGKFCVLGALATEGVFVGIEQRLHLVTIARKLAGTLGIERASFVHGNVLDLDWSRFTAFYLFNPFWENMRTAQAIDWSIPLSEALFAQYVIGVQERLANCPAGTLVGILNGFGGGMPRGYRVQGRRFVGDCFAELWLKI